VRRLERGVSTALLRELCEELAPVAPVRWQQLLDGQAWECAGPQRRQQTPLLVASVLIRALEVVSGLAYRSHSMQKPASHMSMQLWRASMAASGLAASPIDAGTSETQDVDASDAVGMLNAAPAAAVYERLGVLSPEAARLPLLPASFSTRVQGAADTAGQTSELELTPPDALGPEMRLEVNAELTTPSLLTST
jgi:hypothetical protein